MRSLGPDLRLGCVGFEELRGRADGRKKGKGRNTRRRGSCCNLGLARETELIWGSSSLSGLPVGFPVYESRGEPMNRNCFHWHPSGQRPSIGVCGWLKRGSRGRPCSEREHCVFVSALAGVLFTMTKRGLASELSSWVSRTFRVRSIPVSTSWKPPRRVEGKKKWRLALLGSGLCVRSCPKRQPLGQTLDCQIN